MDDELPAREPRELRWFMLDGERKMGKSGAERSQTGMRLEVPPPERMRGNFAYRYYFTAEFGFGRKAVRYIRRRRTEVILKLLEGHRGGDILDVGCGPGDGTILLERGCRAVGRVVGLDLGWEGVALGQEMARLNEARTHFLQGEAGALPFPAESFDVVVSLELIEHLPHWRAFLVEANRVLRQGGRLILSTPPRAGLHSWLKRAWVRLRGWDRQFALYRRPGDLYERFLARGELLAALEQSGFELLAHSVKIFVFSFLPDWLFPLNRAVEPILESLPGVRHLGVTAFYYSRKVGPAC